MAMDNTIKLTVMPEMTKPLIPLDKYGKPLNYLNLNNINKLT
jgi:hypothetical protein